MPRISICGELAFSTRSRILETVDSPNAFVVRIFSTPDISMQPLMISSPSLTSRGRLSPVSALVLNWQFPQRSHHRAVLFSPGCTTIMLPTGTSSGSTCVSWPSASIFA